MSHPDIVYAAGDHFFYRSDDGGITWEEVSRNRGYEDNYWGPPGIVAGFPIDIQCDLHNPDRLFVNNYGGGNFLSTDGGRTWVDAGRGYTGALMRNVRVDPYDSNLVYAGGRSGLFRSEDGGATWKGLAFPPARQTEITAFAVNPGDPGHLINCPWDMGFHAAVSRDAGTSWRSVEVHHQDEQQILDVAFAPSDPAVVYAGIGQADFKYGDIGDEKLQGGGVFVSLDGGMSWQAANAGKMENLNAFGLAVHPVDPKIVYAATLWNGVCKTVDGGRSWAELGIREKTVDSFAVLSCSSAKIAAAPSSNCLFQRMI